MSGVDHELRFLLSLDGLEFRFARDHTVKIAAREVEAGPHRPHGVKYSLTLHDPAGRRLYGIDNAHPLRRCWRISTTRSNGFFGNEVRDEPQNRKLR